MLLVAQVLLSPMPVYAEESALYTAATDGALKSGDKLHVNVQFT
jgi:hypothetical protein